jgi:zinc protease
MKVVMLEDHTVPMVSYQSWFRVGSVDEEPGVIGITHLFENLLFGGTVKYGPRQFFSELEAKGAEVNAFTSRDYSVYYENFRPELLEKAIDMESDRMANLIVSEEVLRTAKLAVLEERRMKIENSLEGKMEEALWRLAYRRHPYLWSVMGYPNDILSLTAPQVQSYFRSHYQPANVTVVIVGDFKTEPTFEWVKKYYQEIPSQDPPLRQIPNEPTQNEERRLVIREKVDTEKWMQAYHISSAQENDSYALDILNNILFEGMESRAYQRLIAQKKLMTSITGTAYTPTFPGLLIVLGAMRKGVPSAEAEQSLDEILSEVQEKGVTSDEIEIAVKKLKVQLIDSIRTPFGLGQLIGTVQTIFGNPEGFVSDLSKYAQISCDDVQRVAVKYLYQNNRSVVTVRNL